MPPPGGAHTPPIRSTLISPATFYTEFLSLTFLCPISGAALVKSPAPSRYSKFTAILFAHGLILYFAYKTIFFIGLLFFFIKHISRNVLFKKGSTSPTQKSEMIYSSDHVNHIILNNHLKKLKEKRKKNDSLRKRNGV